MERRAFLGGVTGSLLAAPLAAEGQQEKKLPRVGIIWSNATEAGLKDPQTSKYLRAFPEGMRELGWVDGQNVTIEQRTAAGHPERFTDLAEELMGLHVDLIVVNSTAGALKVTQVIPTIPLVVPGGDAELFIRANLIKSLARPGGTVTGPASSTGGDIAGKSLQLLKEVTPRISRVGYLFSPPYRANTIEAAGRTLMLTVLPEEVATPEGFEKAFSGIRKARADALYVGGGQFFPTNRRKIVEFAAKERLPAVYWDRSFAESGGLISYGTDWVYLYRRAAFYVDKILKGAKPGDLPIEQPTKFELVINLKTAKTLGLTIPPSLLGRADEVIQ